MMTSLDWHNLAVKEYKNNEEKANAYHIGDYYKIEERYNPITDKYEYVKIYN